MSNSPKLPIFLLTLISASLLFSLAYAIPIELPNDHIAVAKFKQNISDAKLEPTTLNMRNAQPSNIVKDLPKEPSYQYDVEILESRENKKDNVDFEERFRGPALQMNTNTIYAQNIEMSDADSKESKFGGLEKYTRLTIYLLCIALASVVVYLVALIWRSHVEQRYGMRELLLTSGDNIYVPNVDRFPNNNGNNHQDENTTNNVYNPTTRGILDGQ